MRSADGRGGHEQGRYSHTHEGMNEAMNDGMFYFHGGFFLVEWVGKAKQFKRSAHHIESAAELQRSAKRIQRGGALPKG
jgi:hypothetical protein